MVSYVKDTQVLFDGVSYAHSSALVLGAAQSYAPFSITAGFTPLFTINPAESTAATIARFVATFIMYHSDSRKA